MNVLGTATFSSLGVVSSVFWISKRLRMAFLSPVVKLDLTVPISTPYYPKSSIYFLQIAS